MWKNKIIFSNMNVYVINLEKDVYIISSYQLDDIILAPDRNTDMVVGSYRYIK